jgi:hypothetical protein
MDQHLVVISKNWHEPFIRLSVTDLDLKVVMALDDFAVAVAQEAGVREEIITAVFERVIKQMKHETTKII